MHKQHIKQIYVYNVPYHFISIARLTMAQGPTKVLYKEKMNLKKIREQIQAIINSRLKDKK